MKEHHQIAWDTDLEDELRALVRLGVAEDFGNRQDWTTVCLVAPTTQGTAAIVPRETGVLAGLRAVAVVLDEMECSVTCDARTEDATRVQPGQQVAILNGPAREILSAERTILNFLGYLSGIATQTARYLEKVAGTPARIYDTRKTLPGYRRLARYAVRCGGGTNHRLGLDQAVLIKDNHIALGNAQRSHDNEDEGFGVAQAVTMARSFLTQSVRQGDQMIVEIEVDTLDQLKQALSAKPDIVLLDNMGPETLTQAVALRNELASQVQLEASGGIHLGTIAAIAATGVDRISIGSLTHSVSNLDVGLDWL